MSLILNARKTALVLIDLQKGILGRPLEPHSAAEVIERAVTLGEKLSELGGTVVRVHVGFAKSYADKLNQEVDSPNPAPTGGYPDGFSEFVPEIETLKTDVNILKHHWGAFHSTELDLQLRRRGIDTIVLGGVATNFGVESTAREAWQDNYSVIIAEDLCSSMSAEMHRFAVEKIFPRISRVRKTAEVLAALV